MRNETESNVARRHELCSCRLEAVLAPLLGGEGVR